MPAPPSTNSPLQYYDYYQNDGEMTSPIESSFDDFLSISDAHHLRQVEPYRFCQQGHDGYHTSIVAPSLYTRTSMKTGMTLSSRVHSSAREVYADLRRTLEQNPMSAAQWEVSRVQKG